MLGKVIVNIYIFFLCIGCGAPRVTRCTVWEPLIYIVASVYLNEIVDIQE